MNVMSISLRACKLQRVHFKQDFKHMCKSVNLLSVVEDENIKTAQIIMQRPPVNSLNIELINEITSAIKYSESKKHRGLILSSACAGVFSAGLDIKDLYNPDEEKFRVLWKSFQEMWKTLYLTPLITIAAVNGHAPAAGCLLALSCDYRIMIKSKAKIGVHGIKLGIVIPKWFQLLLISNMGFRNAEKSLCQGVLYSAEEALAMKLIDELAEHDNDLLLKAQEKLHSVTQIPAEAYRMQKLNIRQQFVDKLEKYEDIEMNEMLKFFKRTETCEVLRKHLESLKSREK